MTKFKKWRLDNNYSQQDVATAVGCHLNTVCNWDFKDKISVQYKEKFVEVYGIEPVELGLETDYRIRKK